jgi:hypothetical protein
MDQVYGIQLKGDGSGLVGALTEPTKAAEKLEQQLDKTSTAGKSVTQQSKDMVDMLKQQTGASNDAGKAHDFLTSAFGRHHPVLRTLVSVGGMWGLTLAAIGAGALYVTTQHEAFERQLNRTQAALAAQGRGGELARVDLATSSASSQRPAA